jgi:hypothetical protein
LTAVSTAPQSTCPPPEVLADAGPAEPIDDVLACCVLAEHFSPLVLRDRSLSLLFVRVTVMRTLREWSEEGPQADESGATPAWPACTGPEHDKAQAHPDTIVQAHANFAALQTDA